MSDTKIEWADKSWNTIAGCFPVPPGCANCYAVGMSWRLRGMAGAALAAGRSPGKMAHHVDVVEWDGRAKFTGRVNLIPEALDQPLRWKTPRRVFVNSMSDLFHDDVPFDFIAQVFDVMTNCPQHTFLVLTKRPERMGEFAAWRRSAACRSRTISRAAPDWEWLTPGPNVHLGVSVENRRHGLPRIDILRQTPAAFRFLSVEPLLEDLGDLDLEGIDQVIVGGESGPGARDFDPDWARSIRDQCRRRRVAFYMKQITKAGKKVAWEDFPVDLQIRQMEVGK